MKKFYTTGLLFAAMMSLAASAQNVNEFPAYGAKFKPSGTQVQTPMKAPWQAPTAIDDKSKGVTIYAGEVFDAAKQRGWVKFNSKDSYYSMEKLNIFFEEDLSQIRGLRFGAYDGEKYYGYFTRIYSAAGYEYPDFFGSIDVKTGVADPIYTWDDWVNAPSNGLWPMYYDMSYNHADGEFYALGANTEDANRSYSELFHLDKEGQFESITVLPAIYYNFAFDWDGNMYALEPMPKSSTDLTNAGTWLVKFNEDYEVESRTELIKNDGSDDDVVMGTFGALTFDYSTGDLIWHVVTSPYGYAYMYRIPTDNLTAKTTKLEYLGGVMTGNQFCGMYIPYLTADSRTAAGRVTAINALPDNQGQKKTNISWTNPTKAWNLSDLSELAEVRVYRKKASAKEANTSKELLSEENADLIATVDASGKMGEEMQYVDEAPSQGINTYYVVPCRVAGELGVPDSVRCYIGVDVPNVVTDITAEKVNDSSIKLTWKAPELGADNGYINSSELTYTITRKPDNVVVARDITETEYTDNNIDEDNVYSYSIQASTKAGKGLVATSPSVRCGLGVVVPATFTLRTEDEANRWSSEAITGGTTWYYAGPYDYQSEMIFSNSGLDAWLFSPALRLKKDETYRFSYDIQCDYVKTEYSLYSGMFTSPTASAKVADMLSDEYLYSPTGYYRRSYEDKFTPTADGTYHFGFRASTESGDGYHFYNLKVDRLCDYDLSCVAILDQGAAVADVENNMKVQIRNLGKKDVEANSYVVRVFMDTGHGVTQCGYTKWRGAIPADGTLVTNVPFTPRYEGKFDFYAVAEIEGDENAYNNASPKVSINVTADGETPWTNIVTNEETEGEDTHIPFKFYGTNDESKALYYPEEINAPAGAKLMRIGYEYNSSLAETTEEQSVQIYMSNTLERETENTNISLEGMTLVYDGLLTFAPGKNILSIQLDEPFEYDNTKTLCIVAVREGEHEGMFPIIYRVFNVGGTDSDLPTRSQSYGEGTPYNGTETVYRECPLAVLYMAFDNYTAITDINASASQANAPVFTVDGMFVGNSTKSLKKGVYVQNGKKVVIK